MRSEFHWRDGWAFSAKTGKLVEAPADPIYTTLVHRCKGCGGWLYQENKCTTCERMELGK